MSKEDIKEDMVEDIEDFSEDDFREDGEVIDSSLEIGGQIHQQSPIITQHHKHLPKDLKYSNLKKIDLANYYLKSNAYNLYQYVQKVQNLAKEELLTQSTLRKEIYFINTPEELRQHLINIGKMYLWENLRQLAPRDLEIEFKYLRDQLIEAYESGMIEVLYANKSNFYESYAIHKETFSETDHVVDDFGLINSMMTSSELGKARNGWGMTSMNTTINITKNEDLTSEVEEEPEDSENKSKGFFKK